VHAASGERVNVTREIVPFLSAFTSSSAGALSQSSLTRTNVDPSPASVAPRLHEP
jgi:hypothetical protein